MKTRSYPQPRFTQVKVTQAQEDVKWPGFAVAQGVLLGVAVGSVLLAAAGACVDAVGDAIIYTTLQAAWFSQAILILASNCPREGR